MLVLLRCIITHYLFATSTIEEANKKVGMRRIIRILQFRIAIDDNTDINHQS